MSIWGCLMAVWLPVLCPDRGSDNIIKHGRLAIGKQRHLCQNPDGQVLAYTFGQRKDEVFLQLKKLLEPFGIKNYCTDGWGAYERHLPTEKHEVGKKKTQRIERKHLRLRTRIKRLTRKTICFSKSKEMHDLVIGLFINRYEFGLNV